MKKIIKELSGHSGSKIFLMESVVGLSVIKISNVDRNYERLTTLYKEGYPVPKILSYVSETLEMEYIHGLDIKNYLIHNTTNELQQFIIGILKSFSKKTVDKDYTEVYNKKLDWLNYQNELPFTKKELISRLPKNLPQSMYHGDMTLENIIYTDPSFHMIDGVTVEYDSFIFDIAKLRQDLECKWFLRNNYVKLDFKLQKIQNTLKLFFPEAFDDNLLILMLLRVYLHTKDGDFERDFILKEINKLWK